MKLDFDLYSAGVDDDTATRELPLFERSERLDDPALYLPDQGLRDAVNVALALGQPLLLTGEPGTGKTQLAASLAWTLGRAQPLPFHVKTTSTARDLFYRYDSLRHFHDTHIDHGQLKAADYVTYEALGLAILLAMEPREADSALPPEWRGRGPRRSVVLIDEIDKAPRDLPNDILTELDQMSFTVPEIKAHYRADARYRPVIVFTSNSEKNLPDAFLRRCVFYYIQFPDAIRLRQIVERRLAPSSGFTPAMLDAAITHFEEIRRLDLTKRPATAEFLAWTQILSEAKIDVSNLQSGQAEILALSYSTLAKTREDLDQLLSGVAQARHP